MVNCIDSQFEILIMLNVLRYKYSEDHVTVLTTHYIIIRIMYFNRPHYMTILM